MIEITGSRDRVLQYRSYLSYIEVVPSSQTLARIADTAAEQWGILTRRQIEDSGVAAATLQRLTADGTLQRVAHGVYQLAGSPIPDHLALRAAWLQLAPTISSQKRFDWLM